ncbi:uncharacterized protein LOC132728313 [Ruditapes philippinarum]|uniref:uncharacterized protein LOC132728313 n=1 Tax=Ruditapes philippinarum TaxID=129788 RepID=UPI00295BFF43|nr:uncharacterized protein LOC132728313 [Ruditapes philippinarum]
MLDFLFRFSVLNMAFSVIAKEIGQYIGSLGGPWFFCIYLWTLFLFSSEWWSNVLQLQVTTAAAGCFLLSYIYLTLVSRIKTIKYLNLLEIRFIRNIADILMKLSFPFVLWRYVWGPFNNGLRIATKHYFGTNQPAMIAWIVIGLSVFFMCIVVSLCCQGSSPKPPATSNTRRHRNVPPVPKRPHSSRIQALQARQRMRPHSVNGK